MLESSPLNEFIYETAFTRQMLVPHFNGQQGKFNKNKIINTDLSTANW